MKDLKEIKTAIISIEHGVVSVVFGEINARHPDYHDRVSLEISGSELRIKGCQISTKTIYDTINEYDKSFELCCQRLFDFEESIEISKKFTWFNNLKLENFKEAFSWSKLWFKNYKCVHNSAFGTKYIYKYEFWRPMEYCANNWVITELGKSGEIVLKKS